MPEPITSKFVDVQDEAVDRGVQLQATREGLAVVLLNRPERGNALGTREIAALTEAFVTLQGAEGVRLVVLRGAGGNFSIGGDPAWMRETLEMPEEDNRLFAVDLGRMLEALRAVEGAAVGAGAGLITACDMAAATSDALFAFPEVRLGLTPGALAPFVVEAVGARAARRLFASGHSFDAAEALRVGLIDEVCADADALNALQDRLADELTAPAPGAMDATKRLVAHVAAHPLDRSVLEDAARRFARQAASAEAKEGLTAFLGARKADWAR
jgi:methylglutaconyl-CoA hydratase